MKIVALILLVVLILLLIQSFLFTRTYIKRERRFLAAEEALEEYIMGDLQKEYIYQNHTYTPSSVLKELSDIDEARTTERGRRLVKNRDKAYIDYLLVHKKIDDKELFISVYDRASSDEDIGNILKLKKYL